MRPSRFFTRAMKSAEATRSPSAASNPTFFRPVRLMRAYSRIMDRDTRLTLLRLTESLAAE
jgi:hypothetical protein